VKRNNDYDAIGAAVLHECVAGTWQGSTAALACCWCHCTVPTLLVALERLQQAGRITYTTAHKAMQVNIRTTTQEATQ
jgi:hypothetical protein